MEIKRGISQMAEYPNVEINYVLPKSGNMHYVLKDGILDNGVIIATLDPRHAIDEANPCQNIGVFSAAGDILVDFNKKDIKRITDNLLLVVNSIPSTNLIAPVGDMTAESNRNLIVQMMMQEMGPSGEMIFNDPYSEANVYATDSYNNKLGLDCSFIGKNREGLFFHTNDVNSLSKFIRVEEFDDGSNDSSLGNNMEMGFEPSDIEAEQLVNNIETPEEDDLQLNISPTILGGFNIPQSEAFDIPQHIEEPNMTSVNEIEQNQVKNIDDNVNSVDAPSIEDSAEVGESTTDFESEMLKDVSIENVVETESTKTSDISEDSSVENSLNNETKSIEEKQEEPSSDDVEKEQEKPSENVGEKPTNNNDYINSVNAEEQKENTQEEQSDDSETQEESRNEEKEDASSESEEKQTIDNEEETSSDDVEKEQEKTSESVEEKPTDNNDYINSVNAEEQKENAQEVQSNDNEIQEESKDEEKEDTSSESEKDQAIDNEEETSSDDVEEESTKDDTEDYDYKPRKNKSKLKNRNKSKHKYHLEEEEEENMEMDKSRRYTRKNLEEDNNETEVLDDAIELINKMMDETDRLNRRIRKLEERLEEKEEIIKEQSELIEVQNNKKNELNSVLNKASKLLDNME